MSTLYLIGTNHRDLKGPERFEKFLNYVRPGTIAIECSVEEGKWRLEDYLLLKSEIKKSEEIMRETLGNGEFEKIENYLTMMGYEIWVPHKYNDVNPGTKLFYLDDLSQEEVRELEKEIFGSSVNEDRENTGEFIDNLLNMDLEDYQTKIDASYDDNSVQPLQNEPEKFERFIIERDKSVESGLRAIPISPSENVVYVGGYLHFFGEYTPNLFDRLQDINPIRIKLKEIDNF